MCCCCIAVWEWEDENESSELEEISSLSSLQLSNSSLIISSSGDGVVLFNINCSEVVNDVSKGLKTICSSLRNISGVSGPKNPGSCNTLKYREYWKKGRERREEGKWGRGRGEWGREGGRWGGREGDGKGAVREMGREWDRGRIDTTKEKK